MTKSHPIEPKKIALMMATLALVAGLGWVGAYGWANQVSAQALAAVRHATAQSVSKSEVITFAKMLDRTAANRQLVGRYFITSETVVNLLSDLDNFGRLAGVGVEVTEVAEDKELLLTIEATGSWSAVNHFVGLVELAPYAIEIRELKFGYGVPTADGRQAVGTPWTVKLNLAVTSFDSQP